MSLGSYPVLYPVDLCQVTQHPSILGLVGFCQVTQQPPVLGPVGLWPGHPTTSSIRPSWPQLADQLSFLRSPWTGTSTLDCNGNSAITSLPHFPSPASMLGCSSPLFLWLGVESNYDALIIFSPHSTHNSYRSCQHCNGSNYHQFNPPSPIQALIDHSLDIWGALPRDSSIHHSSLPS